MQAALRSALTLALCCAASCGAPGLVASFAENEARRTSALASSVSDFAKGEARRTRNLSRDLAVLGGEFARVRRIPEILRGIQSEVIRPKSGLARALEIWRHETRRTLSR